jgi:hypothetical protein
MPYVIRPASVRRSLCALLGAALFACAIPAVAGACTLPTGGSAAFAAFGDQANYTLAPNGSFESGAAGWSLSRSSVAAGNESFFLNSNGDSHSLSISANGSAVSPPICVGMTTPTFRFVARRTNGSWAQMNVNLLWTDASGTTHTTTAGSIMGDTNWAVSSVMNLGSSLPLWQSDDTLSVRLQFSPAQYGGDWAIDDVYIDPYAK